MSDNDVIKVVILGGGFAGVYAAKYLERALGRRWRRRVQVTIVARENYIVFQPMLPEIIGGSIELLHTITPIRRLGAPRATLPPRDRGDRPGGQDRAARPGDPAQADRHAPRWTSSASTARPSASSWPMCPGSR